VTLYSACREHTSEALRYGTRSQGISVLPAQTQFFSALEAQRNALYKLTTYFTYLHTPRSSANGINHTCLCLPSRSWYSSTEGWNAEL